MSRRFTILGWMIATLGLGVQGSADTANLSDDTNINLNQPNQNNGDSLSVHVRNAGTGGVRHAFARFDLPQLTGGISEATLRLFVSNVPNDGSITLHVVWGDWDEDTLSAGTVPAVGTPFATVAIS